MSKQYRPLPDLINALTDVAFADSGAEARIRQGWAGLNSADPTDADASRDFQRYMGDEREYYMRRVDAVVASAIETHALPIYNQAGPVAASMALFPGRGFAGALFVDLQEALRWIAKAYPDERMAIVARFAPGTDLPKQRGGQPNPKKQAQYAKGLNEVRVHANEMLKRGENITQDSLAKNMEKLYPGTSAETWKGKFIGTNGVKRIRKAIGAEEPKPQKPDSMK